VREECAELLAQDAARLRKAGWGGTTLTRSGHPGGEIVKAAETLGTDLVVVGSHGRTGIKRYLLGSVSAAVLEYAPCSVLIVKGAPGQHAVLDPLRMVIAYDDSQSANKAVDFCAELPLGEKVEVTAVSVMPLVTLFRQDIKQRLSWIWHEKKRAARDALERVTKEVRWATPHVKYQLRESSDITDELLKAAETLDADLIVVGNKGLSAIERFLIGSVTSRIARHAPCSVLAVRA
jgi:nucleotide-binding universal stress UspA family protein